jgi:hypothetical protein
MAYLATHATAGAFIGLMAAQGAAGFFERYGFGRYSEDRLGLFLQR